MASLMKLDRDDKAALVRVATYIVLCALCLVGLLLLGITLGFAVHLFHWAGG